MELIVNPEPAPAIQTPPKGISHSQYDSCIDIFPCSLYYNQRDNNAQ